MPSDDSDERPKVRKAGPKGGKPLTQEVKPIVAKTKSSRSGVVLKKKELIDRAAEKSGVRKTDARSAIEAALDILSDALVAGDEVVVPPLGKVRMMVTKDNGKSRVMTLRVQVTNEGESENEPLADSQD